VTKECIQDQEIMKTPISCGMQLAIIAILEGISEGRISKSDILSCTASTRATRKRDTTFEVQKPQLPLRPA
jgi:2-hydroxy-3-keto-5-methylthiopentenyl-1-phosphate phosphatase